MVNANTIKKQYQPFIKWLSERGAQIIDPTSEWELLRFKAGDETSVIYTNKIGGITFTGSSETAWQAFKSNQSWRAAPSTSRKRRKASKRRPIVISLFKRDGVLCFYCQRELGHDYTIEHLVALTHGGPDHISNMVLAHKECNNEAGNLPVIEKIKIHVKSVT